MNSYLYLTIIPEALVASMIPPEEFGPYVTSGSRKCFHGRTLFFEVDPKKLPDYFDLSLINTLCNHPDGNPKRSLTISLYRVLENIPLNALGRLFLVTRDGRYIAIDPKSYENHAKNQLRLYQELCPIRPTVVSKLQPDAFRAFMTNPKSPVHVPKLLFADLLLGQIADPKSDVSVGSLPYADMGNIRDAVAILNKANRDTLVVDRAHSSDFFYRTIDEGFFVGDGKDLIHYPFPSREEREESLHAWWRSAEIS
ncbi:MAG: hypothetical protein AMXMBFR84_44530 [Candidatus Hydrogenedentota bacterium]